MCTVPRGSCYAGDGGGWVRSWDGFPAEGLCSDRVLWAFAPRGSQWKEEAPLCRGEAGWWAVGS